MPDMPPDDVGILCQNELFRESEHASPVDDHEPPRWGNSRGLTALEKLDYSLNKVSVIEPKLAQAEEEIEILRRKVDVLSMSSEAYLSVRSRFFSVYRRDIACDATANDQKIIAEGNGVAHDGDPLVDSELVRLGRRQDDDYFEELYGLPWVRVPIYKDNGDLLHLLRVHATAKADGSRPVEPEIEAAFRKLIKALRHGGYPTDFMGDEGSVEKRLYWGFWDAWVKSGRRTAPR